MKSLLPLVCCLSLLVPLAAQAKSGEITAPSGWLGLGITCEHDAETEDSFLLVHGTAPSGPASKADLEAGDIIQQVNGVDAGCQTQLDVLELFRDLEAGQRVRLSVLRAGERRVVELQATEMPEHLEAMWVRQYRRLRTEDAANDLPRR